MSSVNINCVMQPCWYVTNYYFICDKKLLCKVYIYYMVTWVYSCFKSTFYIHKLIPKNTQITTLYTNWSLYITFTMIYYNKNNFVNVSHHYITSGGYQVCL